MAKKSISPKKNASASDAPPAVKTAKPRARATTPKKRTDKNVGVATVEATAVSVVAFEPTDDEIRLRAYHRYLERGAQPGNEIDDWVEARKELLSHRPLAS